MNSSLVVVPVEICTKVTSSVSGLVQRKSDVTPHRWSPESVKFFHPLRPYSTIEIKKTGNVVV